jgi:phosphoserine aminotransferase
MKHNFYAGPAILPQEVLTQAADAVKSFGAHNLSLIEISHRSKDFVDVIDEATALVTEILGLKASQKVLFLGGGASSQFFMSAMNLLPQHKTAAYIDTGTWSHKAIKEAHQFGHIDIIASSEEDKYRYIPKDYALSENTQYLHFTSNNTVYGTQFQKRPDVNVPLVCDMSSDIFSKPIDASKYALIYAGAQKNLGPAGVALVIVDEDHLGKTDRSIPTMLDYRTHIKKGSMFNTPPVFPIYVSMLTLRWIKKNGGLAAMQRRNEDKASLLYGEIDRNSLFTGNVAAEDRSRMNVTFDIVNKDLTDDFIKHTEAHDCVGLKGHRSVGGFRASIYNAMEINGVQVLVDAMKSFETEHG